jgi:hypothetical protein
MRAGYDIAFQPPEPGGGTSRPAQTETLNENDNQSCAVSWDSPKLDRSRDRANHEQSGREWQSYPPSGADK